MLGNTLFTFIVAYLYTLIFEQPFIALEKFAMSFKGKSGGHE